MKKVRARLVAEYIYDMEDIDSPSSVQEMIESDQKTFENNPWMLLDLVSGARATGDSVGAKVEVTVEPVEESTP